MLVVLDHTGNIIVPIIAITKISYLSVMFRKNEPIEPRLTSSISLKELSFLSEFKQKFFESEKKIQIKKKDYVAKVI